VSIAVGWSRRRVAGVVPLALGVLLAAGLGLRFWRLEHYSLWLDELWSAAVTDPAITFRQMMDDWLLPDVHPPLYYFILRWWREAFGGEEWALRLPSAIASAACVAVVPLVQRWTPVVRRPLLLAAWLAVSYGAIWYAQEARSYAFLLLFATAATCLSVGITRRIGERQPILGAAIVLAVCVLTIEYIHYFGVLIGAAAFGAPFAVAIATRNRRALLIILATGGASLLLFLPWLAYHAPHITGLLGGVFWIKNNWGDSVLLAGFAAGTPLLFAGLALPVVVALAWRPGLARRPEYVVPLVSIAVMLAGAIAISLHTPVITARNLLILLPPVYVIAVAAFGDLEELAGAAGATLLRLVSAALVALGFGFAAWHVATDGKDQWREAAAFIAALPGCESGPLTVTLFAPEVYGYYLPPAWRDRVLVIDLAVTRATPEQVAELNASPCPLVLWAGHTGDGWTGRRWYEQLGLTDADVVLRTWKGQNVVLRRDRLE
jgi:hypothetical protein